MGKGKGGGCLTVSAACSPDCLAWIGKAVSSLWLFEGRIAAACMRRTAHVFSIARGPTAVTKHVHLRAVYGTWAAVSHGAQESFAATFTGKSEAGKDMTRDTSFIGMLLWRLRSRILLLKVGATRSTDRFFPTIATQSVEQYVSQRPLCDDWEYCISPMYRASARFSAKDFRVALQHMCHQHTQFIP